ncbi:hypothetical protein [Arthrobacter sp. H5]|uniref:hypothetical protein n=1 Tax=Arthrobacter sp. H5 TaxID=1267973 RepID=UPI000482B74E|nr:hypothetical protein [Arthrobacter sp. H5]
MVEQREYIDAASLPEDVDAPEFMEDSESLNASEFLEDSEDVDDPQYAEAAGMLVWSSDQPAVGANPQGLDGQAVHPPVGELDFEAALDGMRELAILRSWVDAVEVRLTSRIRSLAGERAAGHGFTGVSGDQLTGSLAAAEIACVLRIPMGSAKRLVEESVLLTAYNKPTLESLQEGRLSRRHAVAVGAGVRRSACRSGSRIRAATVDGR